MIADLPKLIPPRYTNSHRLHQSLILSSQPTSITFTYVSTSPIRKN